MQKPDTMCFGKQTVLKTKKKLFGTVETTESKKNSTGKKKRRESPSRQTNPSENISQELNNNRNGRGRKSREG